MLNRYQSTHANQIHQLSVSVSKHYYASRDGLLKFQKKAFDVSLANAKKSDKDHLVIYSLRDHFSGLFYIELAFLSTRVPVQAFLARAWGEKTDADVVLYGLPDFLMVPKTVSMAFPGIDERVAAQNIELLPVTSGFQSGGLMAVKAVENYLVFNINTPVNLIGEAITLVCRANAKSRAYTTAPSKSEIWQRSVSEIFLPTVDFFNE
uniref:hypothetical protein n=1 Tax=Serratia quinivorans TaxID=137545 RepID=UPI0035C776E8